MLKLLPAALRGVIACTVLGLNTLIGFTLMIVPALVKLLVPIHGVRMLCTRVLSGIASGWVAVNNAWIVAVGNPAWDVNGVDGLHERGWYLVSPNHQSWVDILVLQRVFHGRIPFLKFFLKHELIWVPVIGMCWWALDFPFMKRGRSSGAKAADLATTREACEKFKKLPTTVINFVEGTRYTEAKHEQQKSPYRHLLKPKIGALSVALASMGEQFEALLDVTLVYPDGRPTFWHLLCGEVGRVIVRVQQRPIPVELVGGDPQQDRRLLVLTGRWIETQWQEKDALIEQLLSEAAASASKPR